MTPPLLLPPPLEPLRPADSAQAVLAAFTYRYGLSKKEIRSIACGFGGGAVSGALMVLGLHCWDDEAEVSSTKELIDLKIPQEPRFHPKYWSQPFG